MKLSLLYAPPLTEYVPPVMDMTAGVLIPDTVILDVTAVFRGTFVWSVKANGLGAESARVVVVVADVVVVVFDVELVEELDVELEDELDVELEVVVVEVVVVVVVLEEGKRDFLKSFLMFRELRVKVSESSLPSESLAVMV